MFNFSGKVEKEGIWIEIKKRHRIKTSAANWQLEEESEVWTGEDEKIHTGGIVKGHSVQAWEEKVQAGNS